LRLESVGAQDNFFELGGNSLLALQAAEELREVVGQEVPVVQLYQHPTVERLAQALSRETKEAGSAMIDSVADRASKQRQALQRRDRRRPT
jgi:aryl carrier-like protein